MIGEQDNFNGLRRVIQIYVSVGVRVFVRTYCSGEEFHSRDPFTGLSTHVGQRSLVSGKRLSHEWHTDVIISQSGSIAHGNFDGLHGLKCRNIEFTSHESHNDLSHAGGATRRGESPRHANIRFMAKSGYVALLLFLFVPAAHAELIVNGGFENGDFTGWTESGWFIDTLNPASGVYDASTGCSGASCTTVGDPNSAYLYQDVATTPGTTYDLSFFYDSGQLPTLGSELLVLWGNPAASSLSAVVDFVDVDTSGAYAEYSGTVTATSATSQLEFLGRQDLDFYSLDDISLTAPASAVPEPGSLSLLASSFIAAALYSICSRMT